MLRHGALSGLQTACRCCIQSHAVPACMLMWQTSQGSSSRLTLLCRVVGVSVVMWLIVLVCVLISGPIGDTALVCSKMVLPITQAWVMTSERLSGLSRHNILISAELAGACLGPQHGNMLCV